MDSSACRHGRVHCLGGIHAMTVHINRPRWRKVIGYEHELKWCFACRARLWHQWTVFVDENPWYEPTGRWVCQRCDRDHTRFPG